MLSLIFAALTAASVVRAGEPVVPPAHPYLFGNVENLKSLAAERHDIFVRMAEVALEIKGADQEFMFSAALGSAVTGDKWMARAAVERALLIVRRPIRIGHETFGLDLMNCAVVFDLCHEAWSEGETAEFIDYMNRTVDANVGSETSTFHNGYYSYKNAGIGVACFATWRENPRARGILETLERDVRERVLPSWRLCGDGGGWAEGYYIHYWLLPWLIYCDISQRLGGPDWFAESPEFLGRRAVASMFECYPGIGERGTRHYVPRGDSGGRVYTWERDQELTSRRILAGRFRDDPEHRAVVAFDRATPEPAQPNFAWMDFLFRDTTLAVADLGSFRLSHLSEGPGFVFARSSWEDDATWFYFKSGDRFTSHQHLDVGHFNIFKYSELAGDGGQFYSFATDHEVNYLLRSVAHSTVLVRDPAETWPRVRAYPGKISNDGGQHHDWPHHNGAVQDAADFTAHPELYDIADLPAFEDRGTYLYVAGDCSRAYRKNKLEEFTRQIVFLRPGSFVIFDRVRSTKAEYKKTWLLQAMNVPERLGDGRLVVANGRGRLFVQTLLPRGPNLKLVSGDSLYVLDGEAHLPEHDVGPAPACRVEISPSAAAKQDYFLHVLNAVGEEDDEAAMASVTERGNEVRVVVGEAEVIFFRDRLGGRVRISGVETPLADSIVVE